MSYLVQQKILVNNHWQLTWYNWGPFESFEDAEQCQKIFKRQLDDFEKYFTDYIIVRNSN